MISDIHFQYIGSKHFLSPPSLVFSYDSNKCLINVGENIQRYCFEHKIRLSKLKCILLTNISLETVGGLPGLLLTLNGIGIQKLRIFGPEPLTEYLLMFGYVVRSQKKKDDSIITKISVSSNEFLDNCFEKKSELEIEIVEFIQSSLEPSKFFKINLENNIIIDCYLISNKTRYKFENEECHLKRPFVNLSCNNDRSSIIYYFEFPDKRGKFDLIKAKELGIPPGPLYSKLKNGESITLIDSKIIFPEEVCSPPIKFPWVIVLNISNKSQDLVIHSILSQILFSKGYLVDSKTQNDENNLCDFYIFQFIKYDLPKSKLNEFENNIVRNQQNSLKGQIKIIRLNDSIFNLMDHEFNPFQTSYYLQEFLNSISPEIFPQESLNINEYYWNKKFVISPNKKSCQNQNSLDNINKKKSRFFSNSDESIEKTKNLKNSFRNLLSDKNNSNLINHKKNFPLLYILGTGSAIPSPYRNVSGNLLYIEENIAMLLDCGEGSIFQLFALSEFNIKKFYKHIYNIRIVFISHPHEDHFLGLFQLIQIIYSKEFREQSEIKSECREECLELKNGVFYFNNLRHRDCNNLTILGPRNIEEIFKLYLEKIIVKDRDETNYIKISFIPIGKKNFDQIEFKSNENDSDLKLEPFPVRHIKFSYGIKVTMKLIDEATNQDHFSLVFSGDTIPCSSVEIASENCDILIHEATFDDSLSTDAYRKNHSTISGAIKIASRSSAKILLLTHFSQRYFSAPNIKLEDEELSRFFLNNTLFTMDLMIIPLQKVKMIIPNLHILNSLIRDYLPQI